MSRCEDINTKVEMCFVGGDKPIVTSCYYAELDSGFLCMIHGNTRNYVNLKDIAWVQITDLTAEKVK